MKEDPLHSLKVSIQNLATRAYAVQNSDLDRDAKDIVAIMVTLITK